MSAVTERRKRGEPHPSGDGRVFFGYRSPRNGGGEEWVTAEKLEESRRKSREYAARKYAANPEAHREKSRMWSKANPEKAKALTEKWRSARVGTEKEKERRASYYLKNKDRIQSLNNKWKSENVNLVKEIAVRGRAANPEKVKKWSAEWYLKNQDKTKERAARWREANPEKARILAARWIAANPEKVRVRGSRRRARKRNATHPLHSAQIEIVLLQGAARLRECLGIDFHLDHVTPLTRGGTHHHANLRILPARLNLRKSDKLDSELPSRLLGAIKQWSPYLN